MGRPERHLGATTQVPRLPGSIRGALDRTWTIAFYGDLHALGDASPCVASLLFLIVKRLGRVTAVFSYTGKETEQCNSK